MTEEPAYTFTVSPARCERCSARPAYVLSERQRGDHILLCKRHLEPWLNERRWAALRMGDPYASKAEVERLFPEVVRVIYTEKEN